MSSRLRTCAGCGYRFQAAVGEAYCSSICAGNAATASLLAGLRNLANDQAATRGREG
jgi:hypothetical protein